MRFTLEDCDISILISEMVVITKARSKADIAESKDICDSNG